MSKSADQAIQIMTSIDQAQRDTGQGLSMSEAIAAAQVHATLAVAEALREVAKSSATPAG